MTASETRKPQDNFPRSDLSAWSLGISLAAGMAFFSLGGYYLDRKLQTGMVLTLSGVGLGLVYIGYEIWKFIKSSNDSDG